VRTRVYMAYVLSEMGRMHRTWQFQRKSRKVYRFVNNVLLTEAILWRVTGGQVMDLRMMSAFEQEGA
jgi:hypothetical protein